MKFLLITLVLFISKASSIVIKETEANVKIGTLPENVTHSEPATKHYQFLVDTVRRMAEVGWDHVKEPYEPFQTNDIILSIWNTFEVHINADVKGLFKTKKSSNTVDETIVISQRFLKVNIKEENKSVDITANVTVKEKHTGKVVVDGTYEIKAELSQEGAIGIEENYFKGAYQITSAKLKYKIKTIQIREISSRRSNSGGKLPASVDLPTVFDDLFRGIVKHGIQIINKNLEKFTVTQIDAYLGLSIGRPRKN